MTKNIIEVIKVVIKNFFLILGFFGAPRSLPCNSSLNFAFWDLIPIGKIEKKTIHQIDM